MKARNRRWLAFEAGCVVGVGLGGLAQGVISDADWFARYPNVPVGTGGAPTVWIACLVIGAGLGAALAAVIPDDREPDRDPSEQPDDAEVATAPTS